MEKIIIISLGGSIVVSRKIQTDYLKRFYNFIVDQIASGKKFIIIYPNGEVK